MYTFFCGIVFYFFSPLPPPKTILRSTALLFNFQSQKSFSVLLVYKNLTHLHTNKTPVFLQGRRALVSASKVVLYLMYIILLFLYTEIRTRGCLRGEKEITGGGFTKVERGLCNCYETPSRWRQRFEQVFKKQK